jgi:hypothetical protein
LELSVLAIRIAFLVISEAPIEQEKSAEFSPEAPQAPIEDEAAEVAPLVEGSEAPLPLREAAIPEVEASEVPTSTEEGVAAREEDSLAELVAVPAVKERELPAADEEANAAGIALEAPEAPIAEGVSPEVAAEAPDASTEEVKATEVAPEVEEKEVPALFVEVTQVSAPSIEEANLEVKEHELPIVADAGSAAPEVPE